jgi:hypothetical protein
MVNNEIISDGATLLLLFINKNKILIELHIAAPNKTIIRLIKTVYRIIN